MSKLVWDELGKHFYETGVDHGVLYPMGDDKKYGKGVAWNGLTSVQESPSGAEASPMYADNVKYLNLLSNEDYAATIEAYTYPDEFAACDGSKELSKGISISQQTRKKFCFVYRTIIGNDVAGNDYGYKLHIVYNCLAAPSQREHGTVNDSPEAITMSWEISTEPVQVKDSKPTATLTIDSTKVDAAKLKSLEDKLFGSANAEPAILMPDEVVALVGATTAGGSTGK